MNLLLLALAGAAGTLARFGLHTLVQRLADTNLPVGTLVVNALGSFLFGLIWPLAEERLLISPEARRIVLVGFMGAFTTFSTFAFETGQLARDAQWTAAMGNIVAQNTLGIGLFLLGLSLGRLL
jgi:fluoride exporter